ncbi:MAG: Txe/YoeB family addiction module toxin [Puniceicoccales bacterium]|jgi:toxin YoeB|nr:Txe/YoeB family addiction module toxin [Puniceicoccales bacterium]
MVEYETTKRFDKDFKRFQKYDEDTTAKIKILMVDILEHPMEGLGQPERLRHRKGNWWSRRIDLKNRLVYRIIGDIIRFEQCRGHYDDH